MSNGSAAAPKTRPSNRGSVPDSSKTASKSITEHRIRGTRSPNSQQTVYIGPSIAACGKSGLTLGISSPSNAGFGHREDDRYVAVAGCGSGWKDGKFSVPSSTPLGDGTERGGIRGCGMSVLLGPGRQRGP
jgi:hypothetical protein